MCSEEQLGQMKCTKVISCCYNHVEWGSLKFLVRAGMKSRLQDDEKNAAEENSMMIKTAKLETPI